MYETVAVEGVETKFFEKIRQAFQSRNVLCRVWDPQNDRRSNPPVKLLIVQIQANEKMADVFTTESSANMPPHVVLTASSDAALQAKWIAAGAKAVLSTLLPLDELVKTILAVYQNIPAVGESPALQEQDWHPRLSDFSSASPAMRAFMQVVERVVHSHVPLLVQGETGVGKEWLSRSIHNESPRSAGPFVAVNCGALPEGLLESELFGHEKGAFTGATGLRRGHFEMADGGTIFLDEVGELPLHTQVKLLRVLQDHNLQRLGNEKPLHVDVRVIAATNRDISTEVEAGRFRRDLYYRLGVLTLNVPPLRERREDIPALVDAYIEYFRPQVNVGISAVSEEALQALVHYDWPGNVRELINVIERAMILCGGDKISMDDLPVAIAHRPVLIEAPAAAADSQLHLVLEEYLLDKPLPEARCCVSRQFERIYLSRLLRETGGRINATAQRAGIKTRSLHERMRRLGLDKNDFIPSNKHFKFAGETSNQ